MRMGLQETSVSNFGRSFIATRFSQWPLSLKEWIHLILHLVMIIEKYVLCIYVVCMWPSCLCVCDLWCMCIMFVHV